MFLWHNLRKGAIAIHVTNIQSIFDHISTMAQFSTSQKSGHGVVKKIIEDGLKIY
jgi:hypothetical protein